MYKLLCFVLFVNASCAKGMIGTKEYRSSVRDVRSIEGSATLTDIPAKELLNHSPLVYGKDTFSLEKFKAIGLQSSSSKKKYIFLFYQYGRAYSIVCDSSWRVESVGFEVK